MTAPDRNMAHIALSAAMEDYQERGGNISGWNATFCTLLEHRMAEAIAFAVASEKAALALGEGGLHALH